MGIILAQKPMGRIRAAATHLFGEVRYVSSVSPWAMEDPADLAKKLRRSFAVARL